MNHQHTPITRRCFLRSAAQAGGVAAIGLHLGKAASVHRSSVCQTLGGAADPGSCGQLGGLASVGVLWLLFSPVALTFQLRPERRAIWRMLAT